MRPTFIFQKPYGVETCTVLERMTVSSSSAGLSYNDVPLYTSPASIQPIPTLFSIFTYYELLSVELSYTPITLVSTSATILEFFTSLNPLTSYGTPSGPLDPMNYPGVRVCLANNSTMRWVVKPKNILKKLGYPYQFICGSTPTYQPTLRYGIMGGTTTTAIGILTAKYVVKLSGSTNNADGMRYKDVMLHLAEAKSNGTDQKVSPCAKVDTPFWTFPQAINREVSDDDLNTKIGGEKGDAVIVVREKATESITHKMLDQDLTQSEYMKAKDIIKSLKK